MPGLQAVGREETHQTFEQHRLAGAVQPDHGDKIAFLGALGAGLEPGPDLYFRLLENIGAELTRCLNR